MEKVIYLAGGCFWGMEHLYRALPGVLEVTAGYANGVSAEKANYKAVCSGVTGFRETVRVEYDPERTSLEHLLFAFSPSLTRRRPTGRGRTSAASTRPGSIGWMRRTSVSSSKLPLSKWRRCPGLPWS